MFFFLKCLHILSKVSDFLTFNQISKTDKTLCIPNAFKIEEFDRWVYKTNNSFVFLESHLVGIKRLNFVYEELNTVSHFGWL